MVSRKYTNLVISNIKLHGAAAKSFDESNLKAFAKANAKQEEFHSTFTEKEWRLINFALQDAAHNENNSEERKADYVSLLAKLPSHTWL